MAGSDHPTRRPSASRPRPAPGTSRRAGSTVWC